MTWIIIIFIVIIILGVLFGGESFGDTIRKGCGCLVSIIIIGALLVYFGFFN